MSYVTRWTLKGQDGGCRLPYRGRFAQVFFFFFLSHLLETHKFSSQVTSQVWTFISRAAHTFISRHMGNIENFAQISACFSFFASSSFFELMPSHGAKAESPFNLLHMESVYGKQQGFQRISWSEISRVLLQRYNIESVMVNGAKIQVCVCAHVCLYVCLPPIPHCWNGWKTRRSAHRHILIWFITIETLGDSMYKKPAENLGGFFFFSSPLTLSLFLFHFN